MARQEPLESSFQRKVLTFLKHLPNTYYFKKEAVAIRGIPDIICCINGIFVALELKRSIKHKATELQQYTIELIKYSGGIAMVTHPQNWEDVQNLLQELAYKDCHQQE
jgi:hypothetical protein